ncbi:MAG: redoxin domain-containing protein [Mucilaginibacter sp.]
MKKHFTYIGAVLIAILAFASCAHDNEFVISGTVKNRGNVKAVYLLEADSTQISVVDSTMLSQDGTFKFKHNGPYANLYKLRVGTNIFDLIAKNGDDITFNTDLNDNLHNYTIDGSQESQKIQEYNKISNYYIDKNNKIVNEYQAKAQALGKESDSLLKVYRPLFLQTMDDEAAATLKFVNANKSSLAAFYAATSLDPDKYEQQLIAYADAIKGQFSGNPAVRQFEKQMEATKPISIGHAAPDFSTVSIDNKPVKLSDYKGKYVMLDFWASWCGPCRQENPNVVKQYAAFHQKGLNILGISLDTSKTNWQQAISADKITWAQASDMKNFDGPTERLYHIEAIPSNFIIDPKGIIIAKNLRGEALEDFLNKTFNKPE